MHACHTGPSVPVQQATTNLATGNCVLTEISASVAQNQVQVDWVLPCVSPGDFTGSARLCSPTPEVLFPALLPEGALVIEGLV